MFVFHNHCTCSPSYQIACFTRICPSSESSNVNFAVTAFWSFLIRYKDIFIPPFTTRIAHCPPRLYYKGPPLFGGSGQVNVFKFAKPRPPKSESLYYHYSRWTMKCFAYVWWDNHVALPYTAQILVDDGEKCLSSSVDMLYQPAFFSKTLYMTLLSTSWAFPLPLEGTNNWCRLTRPPDTQKGKKILGGLPTPSHVVLGIAG